MCLDQIFIFLFQVRQLQLGKQNVLQFLDADLGLDNVMARLIAGFFALARLLRCRVTTNDIANLAVPVALTDMFLLLVVIHKTVLIQTADWYLDDLLSIGHDNIFLCNQIRQILLNDIFHLLLMALLVLVPFAVKRPIFPGYDERVRLV